MKQLVGRYAGDVRVGASTDLGGASFEVWFPPGGVVVRTAPPPAGGRAAARRARILVVDDEPAILRSMKSLLRHDHDVELADGGRAAIELLKHDIGFDLVLCDLNMPDVDGVDVHD